jgi:hypothetical protein
MKSELKWGSDNIHSQKRVIDRGNADNLSQQTLFLKVGGLLRLLMEISKQMKLKYL